jgi:hypothetical protein
MKPRSSGSPRFPIGRLYAALAAVAAVVAFLAVAPAASAKTLRCGKTTLVGTSKKAYNVAYDITATRLSCKTAKSVIKDFGGGRTPKGWTSTNRYIASAHSLKWTLKKGSEGITFEVKKTS